jgi:hypothetical protein
VNRCLRRIDRERERGAYAVLYAVILIVLIALVALVLDIGMARMDRRTARASTDAGAIAGVSRLAGQTLQPANPQQACITAFRSVEQNLKLATLDTSGCNSWPTVKTTCVNPIPAASPPVVGTAPMTASASSGKYRIDVRWPVADSDGYMQQPDLEKWGTPVTQPINVNDGEPCDRMAVGIAADRTMTFGSAFGISRASTVSRSVAAIQIGSGPGDALVPLVVLDHHSCNALTVSGGGSDTGGVRVLSDGKHPGIIAVDSDGRGTDWDGDGDVIPNSYDCGGGKTTIDASTGGANTHIWAYDAPNGTPAEIFSFALGSGQTSTAYKTYFAVGQTSGCTPRVWNPAAAYAASTDTTTWPVLGATLCPVPRTTTERITDARIIERYNCAPATCGAGRQYINTLDAYQAGLVPGPGVYEVPSCAGTAFRNEGAEMVTAGVAAGTPILVTDSNCHIRRHWAFPSDSVVVFTDQTRVFSGGCLMLNMSTSITATNADDYCDQDGDGQTSWPQNESNPKIDAKPVVFRSTFTIQGGGAGTGFVAPQTFIYHKAQLDVGTAYVYWTAPYGENLDEQGVLIAALPDGAPDCTNSPTAAGFKTCFEDLALWNTFFGDTGGSGSPNSFGAQAGLTIEGIWYAPLAQFNFSGDSTGTQRHAQFVAKRLNVVGGGELVMVPDARRQQPSRVVEAVLIR